MSRTAHEIIARLEGTNAAARFFAVEPPSVTGWINKGVIPEGRLIEAAARLEQRTEGWFNRREQWPERFAEIWPELARRTDGVPESAPAPLEGA